MENNKKNLEFETCEYVVDVRNKIKEFQSKIKELNVNCEALKKQSQKSGDKKMIRIHERMITLLNECLYAVIDEYSKYIFLDIPEKIAVKKIKELMLNLRQLIDMIYQQEDLKKNRKYTLANIRSSISKLREDREAIREEMMEQEFFLEKERQRFLASQYDGGDDGK